MKKCNEEVLDCARAFAHVPGCVQQDACLDKTAVPSHTYYYDVLFCERRELSKDIVPEAHVEDPKRPACSRVL